jgi:hypothetical protein
MIEELFEGPLCVWCEASFANPPDAFPHLCDECRAKLNRAVSDWLDDAPSSSAVVPDRPAA